MHTIPCSLIITTYNWPDALEKLLQSVEWQSILPTEVLIADDGSTPPTKELISARQKDFPVPLRHFWHEDFRKRKTRINNIAIAHSSTPYLIFTDHDIILHPDFVRDHLALAEEGYFINGSRFLVNKESTEAFLRRENITPADLQELEGVNALNKIRIPFVMKWIAHLYQTGEKQNHIVRGCNMSFWKKDLISVNGYDETYQGWGREDSDVAVRLFNKGIRKKSIKFGGVGYHLHHKESSKADDDKYLARLRKAIREKSTWAYAGLDQHPRTAALQRQA